MLLGVIGVVTLSAIGLGAVLLNSTADTTVDFWVLSTIYGSSALFGAVSIWRQSSSAPMIYLVWCGSVVAFNLSVFVHIPDAFTWWLVPGFAAALLLLGWGYRYLRAVSHAA